MTTGKPPHPPQKTLLGMPSDVQEALKKLQAQRDQQALQAKTQALPPGAVAQQAPSDLERTLYGNPHDSHPSEPRSSAPRPNLPREQAFQPPVRSPIPQQPRPTPQAAQGIASMQRTMLGMPSDVAAAMRQLQERGPASAPAQAPQAGRPAGSSGASWPPAAESPSPWVQPEGRRVEPSVAQPAAAVAHATQLRQQTAAARAAEPAPSQSPVASRSGVVQKGATRASGPPPLAPHMTNASTAPDRERSHVAPAAASHPGRTGTVNSDAPPAAAPSAAASAGQPNGMLATRLVTFEPGVLVSESASRTSLSEGEVPGLNETDQAGPSRPAPVRRWPALSLLGLAFVAFGGVIVVRAPGLLPAPLAALVARPPAAAPAEPPTAAEAPVPGEPAPLAPAADVAQPTAAEQPEPAAAPAVAQPSAASQPPLAVQGHSAELEKQAIDSLLANDYAAARASYEQLRAAEPARPEYGIMLDLLARELTPACGGPGQVPCTGP
jgi:hypothetical protein